MLSYKVKHFVAMVSGMVCLLLSMYSLLGVLQALLLFSGNQLLRNLIVWVAISVGFLFCAGGCFIYAWQLFLHKRSHLPVR